MGVTKYLLTGMILQVALLFARILPPKLTAGLKNDGWKTSLSFSNGPFSGDISSFSGVILTKKQHQV